MLSFPLILTLLRIAAVPCIIFLLLLGREWGIHAIWIFALAVITDFYDGYYARNYGQVTAAGAFLDPLADKILVLGLGGFFCHQKLISWLVLIVIVARDLLVTGLRMLLLAYQKELVTSFLGKFKTTMQFALIFYLLNYYVYDGTSGHAIFDVAVKDWMTAIAVLFTVFTGLDYVMRHWTDLMGILRKNLS